MDCIKKKVNEELKRGWIGSDTGCEYNPCHFTGQDCTFCYCPFYPCEDEDLGGWVYAKDGRAIWSCSDCLLIHRAHVCKHIVSRFGEIGITDASDPRIAEVRDETISEFKHRGKPLMVVGATSDAGKSVTVAALCRILHRRGLLVAPFKSQNMSLNSKVTRGGAEIAMIQTLQAKAAGLKNPDSHMNPILLKPKGDTVSQVMVRGKPFADYDVESYYRDFVPGPGREIVRENIDFLLKRYDCVLMEGAGSPAEINIYDADIANMGAAKIAGADVILVVNVEWGGSFAYALGTLKLIPEEDRGMIKGVIFNNVRGKLDGFRSSVEEFERLAGVPVLGIVPHADVVLPSEDSEGLRGVRSKGDGKCLVGVVKYTRIANFTDIDPLFLEDVSVVFAESAEDLDGVDAVILPGTKNTINDMKWMESNGIADRLKELRGKVPMLGICGGFQMMGKVLKDPEGLEGGVPGTEIPGLGFFDNETHWSKYEKRIVNDTADMLVGDGGEVTGYELHMGMSDVREKPLFEIRGGLGKAPEPEGSVREEEMLFGTYLHGVLDRMPFRKYFLSFVKHGDRKVDTSSTKDYDEIMEENIEKLADVFEESLDMDAIMKIIGGS